MGGPDTDAVVVVLVFIVTTIPPPSTPYASADVVVVPEYGYL